MSSMPANNTIMVVNSVSRPIDRGTVDGQTGGEAKATARLAIRRVHGPPHGVLREPATPTMALSFRLAVRCEHCQERLFAVEQISRDDEARLRAHLRTKHPTVECPLSVGALLRHFVIDVVQPPAP
jgi:hypothetical protein